LKRSVNPGRIWAIETSELTTCFDPVGNGFESAASGTMIAARRKQKAANEVRAVIP
jgi:hypothetical protein